MRGLDIPIPVIILCFIFGAWPIGVVLAVLKSINNDYKKQTKEQWKQQPKAGNNNTAWKTDFTQNPAAPRTTNYRSPTDSAEGPNGTTYHYSYVKNKTADGTTPVGAPPPFTTVPQGNAAQRNANNAGIPRDTIPKAMNAAPLSTQASKQNGFKSSTSTMLATIFMSVSLVFSLIFFTTAVNSVITFGFPFAAGNVVAAMTASSISAILYLFRKFSKSRDYRIMSYISVLRGERFYSLAKLASVADVSTARVIKDLHFMQSKGLLPADTVIDRGLGYLVMFKDARAEAEAEALGSKPVRTETSAPKTTEEVRAEMTEHEKILHRIRELNDDIDDEAVSLKIDQIEEITRKIFKLVEEKPEMEQQLGPFLSYYLPTTLKLLNSYAYFEEQGIRGENIDAGMRNIEETLDMLIDGYKTQLDKLFESDTLDVTTDINVLEQMMKADGFSRTNDFSASSGGADAGGTATATATLSDEDKEEM